MAEVICVGSAVLDQVYDVPALDPDAVTIFAHGYRHAGAGTAANAAVAVNRLGGTALLWSQVGDDETGDLIAAGLLRDDVDIAGVRRIAGAQSPHSSVIAAADGRRQIIHFDGIGLPADTTWLPLGRVQDTSAVLAEPVWPEGAQAALDQAQAHHCPGILAVGVTARPVPLELATAAQYVLFSPAELQRFTGITDPGKALDNATQKAGGFVGVTSGSDGLHWCEPAGTPQWFPPLAISAVDPAGAWDTFCGAFALAAGEEKTLDTAIAFATTAAGLTAAQLGTRRAMPDRRTVWQRLEADYPALAGTDG